VEALEKKNEELLPRSEQMEKKLKKKTLQPLI
jgi:hypothetical protein